MSGNEEKHNPLLSAYGPDLIDARKAAIARCRGPYGESDLHSVMADECQQRGYAKPYRIAQLCFDAVSDKTFHVIEVGMKRICLSVGRPLMDRKKRELWISESPIPDRPLSRGSGHFSGGLVWGDATVLSASGHGALRLWYLCKNDPGQRHISLGSISDEVAEAFGQVIGIEPWSPRGFKRRGALLRSCPSFESLARWSKAHPRIAKHSTSTYWPGWGDMALAAAEELCV
jgi:hypothetical protein